MPLGVLFSLIAYGIYSCGDAIIKSFSGSLGVFEIGFFTALASVIPAAMTKPKGEHWRNAWKMRHPWLLQLRAVSGLCATMLVIYAFTHIPLAEVYSLAFLTPVFVVIISVLVLKETVSLPRWFFLIVSFLAVLLVVRPGFRELHPGHLAAVGCALFGSINTTVYRTIAGREKRVSLVGVTAAYAIVVNGLLMLPQFTMPTLPQFGLLALIGLCGGTGHLFFIAATRNSPASLVAPAQYSQIIWAIVLGAAFYNEFPDQLAIAGLVVVVLAGIMNVLSDDMRGRLFRRLALLPTAPIAIAVPPPAAEAPAFVATPQAEAA